MRVFSPRWSAFATAAAVALLVLTSLDPRDSSGGEPKSGCDWQAWVKKEAWKFHADEAHPLFCATRRNGKFGAYEIALRVQKGGVAVGIDVIDEKVVKHSWMGHRHSVFVIRGKRLYYADFGPHSTGAYVVAVDLETGQRLWREKCRGIGPVGHSGYRNRVNLAVTKDVLFVRGDESLGRYIEVKSVADGKTLGHKKYERK